MRLTNADKRIELHEKLCDLMGNRNVYFQPPENRKLIYPCIIYNKQFIRHNYADDGTYLKHDEYQIMLITKDPDCDYIEKLAWLDLCHFDRQYVRDNLYHYVFSLYY